MKDDDFGPARIIGRPDAKQSEGADSKISTDIAEPEPVPISETAKPEPSNQEDTSGTSFDGILERFTGKNTGSIVWASPYDMFQNGVFSGLHKSTVDQVATNIRGLIIVTIFHAYLLIGYYLLAVYFDSDESLAFSKNPYKDTSINDLAKRDDIPFSRGKLTDCIKAAAVDLELRKRGHDFDHLNYEHQLQIARLKKQEQRLELARVANENKLTSNELKKLIDSMLGKTASQDKQIARALTRQLREFVRLAADEDVQGFLADKERSAALDHTEMAQLLDFSGKFRASLGESEELLKQLETNLRQNFIENQHGKVLTSGEDTPELEA